MSWSSRYPLIRLLPIKIKKEKKKKHTFLYKVQAQVFFKFFFKNGKNLSISIPSFVPLIFYSRSSDTRYFKSNHELGSAPGRADKKEKKERVCSRPLPVSGHSEKSHSVHRSQRVRLRPCLLPVRFSFPCIPSASMTTKNQRLFGRFDASTRIVAIPQNSSLPVEGVKSIDPFQLHSHFIRSPLRLKYARLILSFHETIFKGRRLVIYEQNVVRSGGDLCYRRSVTQTWQTCDCLHGSEAC